MVEYNSDEDDVSEATWLFPMGRRPNDRKYVMSAQSDVEGEAPVLMPLTNINVKTEIRGIYASIKVEMTYKNPTPDRPYECSYTFPLEKTSFLANLEAFIGDKQIKTQVVEKEEAKERYEDAMAAGNAAVLAERESADKTLSIKLGNLLPGQSATINLHIISQL